MQTCSLAANQSAMWTNEKLNKKKIDDGKCSFVVAVAHLPSRGDASTFKAFNSD